MGESADNQVLCLFADLLDYPRPGLANEALLCEKLLAGSQGKAAREMTAFRSFLERTPLGKQEEIHSAFFDLNPVCHPYIGYHLFGESYKRSIFLLELKQRFQATGYECEDEELPDRLSIVLRFLASGCDGGLKREIIEEGIMPALTKMLKIGNGAGPHQERPQDIQLEGHSHGDVLGPGFVLQMTEDEPGKWQGDSNPYLRLLIALQTALSSRIGVEQAKTPVQQES